MGKKPARRSVLKVEPEPEPQTLNVWREFFAIYFLATFSWGAFWLTLGRDFLLSPNVFETGGILFAFLSYGSVQALKARRRHPVSLTKARALLRQLGEPTADDYFPLQQTAAYRVDIKLVADTTGKYADAVNLLIRPTHEKPDPTTMAQRLAVLEPWLSMFNPEIRSGDEVDDGVEFHWLEKSHHLRRLDLAQLTVVPNDASWWHNLLAFLVAPDKDAPLPQNLPIEQLSSQSQLQLCKAYCGPGFDQKPLPYPTRLHEDVLNLARLLAGDALNTEQETMLFHHSNQAIHQAATRALNEDPARRHHLLGYHFSDKHAMGFHLKHLQREDDALSIPHLIACFHLPYMRSEIISTIQRRDDERVFFFFCDLLVRGATAEKKYRA